VNPSLADEIEQLWSEFGAGGSKIAQLFRSVDALQCMHQAVVYEERSQLVKDLGGFITCMPHFRKRASNTNILY
jgi:hypothetical protein